MMYVTPAGPQRCYHLCKVEDGKVRKQRRAMMTSPNTLQAGGYARNLLLDRSCQPVRATGLDENQTRMVCFSRLSSPFSRRAEA
jgi:hypothetical protein